MDVNKGGVSLKDLLFYFLKLGSIGFGGPIALVASMQRDLVDERGWFSQTTFKEGMALSQMAPGPLAAQMAMYLGWANSGIIGATLKAILLFFAKAGAFVFGSGLAIVPFLHGGVVVEQKWLTEAQFLDAVAVAMITPGPVVITVGFIGFLVAGLAGAIAAAIGTFFPCYLFTVIPAPYFSKISKNNHLREFVSGITSAAVGAILGAAFILGRRSLVDVPTILIFVFTLFGLIFVKKLSEPIWILIAGGVGFLI